MVRFGSLFLLWKIHILHHLHPPHHHRPHPHHLRRPRPVDVAGGRSFLVQQAGSTSGVRFGRHRLLHSVPVLQEVRPPAAPFPRRSRRRFSLRPSWLHPRARQGFSIPRLHTVTFLFRRTGTQNHFLLHCENIVALYKSRRSSQLHCVFFGFGFVGLSNRCVLACVRPVPADLRAPNPTFRRFA